MRNLILPFILYLSLVAPEAFGQGGMRLIIWNYEVLPMRSTGMGLEAYYGLAYDHDLNTRLSMETSLRYGLLSESFVIGYRSAYHFSDNTSGSFYVGPAFGVRVFGERSYGVQVPIGFRLGVRGGLERFYADLYAGAYYNLGSSGRVSAADGNNTVDLRRGTFGAGLDLGFGWDSKRAKR